MFINDTAACFVVLYVTLYTDIYNDLAGDDLDSSQKMIPAVGENPVFVKGVANPLRKPGYAARIAKTVEQILSAMSCGNIDLMFVTETMLPDALGLMPPVRTKELVAFIRFALGN